MRRRLFFARGLLGERSLRRERRRRVPPLQFDGGSSRVLCLWIGDVSPDSRRRKRVSFSGGRVVSALRLPPFDGAFLDRVGDLRRGRPHGPRPSSACSSASFRGAVSSLFVAGKRAAPPQPPSSSRDSSGAARTPHESGGRRLQRTTNPEFRPHLPGRNGKQPDFNRRPRVFLSRSSGGPREERRKTQSLQTIAACSQRGASTLACAGKALRGLRLCVGGGGGDEDEGRTQQFFFRPRRAASSTGRVEWRDGGRNRQSGSS